jgi:hypothetical protein
VQSTHGYLDVQEAARNDERLRRLTLELYPELDPDSTFPARLRAESAEEEAARDSAELHLILQMLQVMENAWLSLNLEKHYAHPLNRGWMDVFYRWTSAPTFRHHWPYLRSEFARGFVSFCERQMKLGVVETRRVRIHPGQLEDPYLDRLLLEFWDQWPEEWDRLRAHIQSLDQEPKGVGWLVYTANPYPDEKLPPEEYQTPCGILLVVRTKDPSTHELILWMRGAYRNTGLGRHAARMALAELPKVLDPRPSRLLVRLPVGNLRGPGGELQKRMWLGFYYNLGFRRETAPGGKPLAGHEAEETEVILYRDL